MFGSKGAGPACGHGSILSLLVHANSARPPFPAPILVGPKHEILNIYVGSYRFVKKTGNEIYLSDK